MTTPTNPVALVTGAARGLGAVIATRLAEDGWIVAVNYRASEELARAVVAGIETAGGRAAAFAADVTDEAAVAALVVRVQDTLGPIGALVVNATGPQPGAPLVELSWQAELDQLEFFVKSPTLLARSVLPAMQAAHRGRIVQISSDVVDRVLIGGSAYAAAKAAQEMLTRIWARELGPDGITVNTVAPGWIPVERHADVDPEQLKARRAGPAPAQRHAGRGRRRCGLPALRAGLVPDRTAGRSERRPHPRLGLSRPGDCGAEGQFSDRARRTGRSAPLLRAGRSRRRRPRGPDAIG